MAKKFLFLIDDGWRLEKRDILLYLKGKLDFDVVTHDPLTYDCLRKHLDIRQLPLYSIKLNPLYPFIFFFARDLDTHLVRYKKNIDFHSYPPYKRLLYGIRKVAHSLGLGLYSYNQALKILYSRSDRYRVLLEGYEALVFPTVEAKDKRIVYEAKSAGLKVISWVFSWDHPLKDSEFFPTADRYLVWNKHTAAEIHRRHGVPLEDTRVVGPVQFDYILEYLQDGGARTSSPPGTVGAKYVLYACALGRNCHLEQEVNVVLNIRRIIDKIDPSIRLLVRPYPFRPNQSFSYEALSRQGSIEILKFGTIRENRVLVTKKDLEEKVRQIEEAECFINHSSTMGLEASFTGTPIVQLGFNFPADVPAYQNVSQVFKNEHLKYLLDCDFPNVARNEEQLETCLRDILTGNKKRYAGYSEYLQSFANPLKASSYKEILLKELLAF